MSKILAISKERLDKLRDGYSKLEGLQETEQSDPMLFNEAGKKVIKLIFDELEEKSETITYEDLPDDREMHLIRGRTYFDKENLDKFSSGIRKIDKIIKLIKTGVK